jgi:uncharacterized membrane protein YfcA
MSNIVICLSAVLVSALTLFSGFGLGTLLLPAFALFFPVEVAVAATAVVHGANNIFKIGIVGRHAEKALVLRFGVPAIIAAFAGASALGYVSHFGEIATYTLGSREAVITPIKVTIGALMLIFALFELLPRLRELKFKRKYLFIGGILSGFFGGFSGHQGALRAAFLAKVGISTEAFVGTNAVIGFMVDMARILTYSVMFFAAGTTSPIGFSPRYKRTLLCNSGRNSEFSYNRVRKSWCKRNAQKPYRLPYNNALQRSNEEQLLANLVRMRCAQSPSFLETDGITTQLSLSDEFFAVIYVIRSCEKEVRMMYCARLSRTS